MVRCKGTVCKAEMLSSTQGDNASHWMLLTYKAENSGNSKEKENTQGHWKVKLFPCLINFAPFHEDVSRSGGIALPFFASLTLIPIGSEAGWASEPVCKLWGTEKTVASARNQTLAFQPVVHRYTTDVTQLLHTTIGNWYSILKSISTELPILESYLNPCIKSSQKHVACMREMGTVCSICHKTQKGRSLWMLWYRWENNTKTDLAGTECDDADWVHLPDDGN
jgi:hypothetical protein